MNYTQHPDGDVLVVRLSGQLMGGPDADGLRETIRGAFERGMKIVILDMEGITWINSAGLGILIASHLLAREAGASLRFVHLSRRIASILSVTRLSTVFETFQTEEEARRATPLADRRSS